MHPSELFKLTSFIF